MVSPDPRPGAVRDKNTFFGSKILINFLHTRKKTKNQKKKRKKKYRCHVLHEDEDAIGDLVVRGEVTRRSPAHKYDESIQNPILKNRIIHHAELIRT